MRERLEPAAEARFRLPDALRDGADRGPGRRCRGGARGRPRRSGSSGARRPRSCRSVRPWPIQSSGRERIRAAYALEPVMARIQMYTTRWCGYCVRAKALLDSKRPRLRGDPPRRRSRLPADAPRPDRRLDGAADPDRRRRRSAATPSSGASTATAGSTSCSPPEALDRLAGRAEPRAAAADARSSRSACRSGRTARPRGRTP